MLVDLIRSVIACFQLAHKHSKGFNRKPFYQFEYLQMPDEALTQIFKPINTSDLNEMYGILSINKVLVINTNLGVQWSSA